MRYVLEKLTNNQCTTEVIDPAIDMSVLNTAITMENPGISNSIAKKYSLSLGIRFLKQGQDGIIIQEALLTSWIPMT